MDSVNTSFNNDLNVTLREYSQFLWKTVEDTQEEQSLAPMEVLAKCDKLKKSFDTINQSIKFQKRECKYSISYN